MCRYFYSMIFRYDRFELSRAYSWFKALYKQTLKMPCSAHVFCPFYGIFSEITPKSAIYSISFFGLHSYKVFTLGFHHLSPVFSQITKTKRVGSAQLQFTPGDGAGIICLSFLRCTITYRLEWLRIVSFLSLLSQYLPFYHF